MKLPVEAILKEYKDGASCEEIAKNYNTYKMKVFRLIKKHGALRDKSEAQALALERGTKKHPTKGTHRTGEEKLKISTKLAENWAALTPEAYNNRVEQSRERWEEMPDSQKAEMHKKSGEALRRVAKEGSSVEKFLAELLRGRGYKVDYHVKKILDTKLEIDMVLPDLKVAIEIDGPSHFKPIWGQDKLEKQQKEDAKKSGIILQKGFVLIRIKYLQSRFNLHVRNTLETQILHLIKQIEAKFPSKSRRLIEVCIGNEQ